MHWLQHPVNKNSSSLPTPPFEPLSLWHKKPGWTLPRDKVLDEEACSRMVAKNSISFPAWTMMEAVIKPPTRGATIGLLARPGVFLAIIRAKRQNSHPGGEKYENAPACHSAVPCQDVQYWLEYTPMQSLRFPFQSNMAKHSIMS
jgi:hypothetical protein